MKRFELLLLLTLGVWAGGCQYILGGVEIKAVQTAVEPPANVTAYLSVTNGKRPMADLGAHDFEIYEDGARLDPTKTNQSLLDASDVADHHTLILLDMSAVNAARAVSRGAAMLVRRIVPQQGVVVYAFDGSSELHLIAEFEKTADPSATPEEFEALTQWKPAGGPRDLNGAIVAAVGRLRNLLGNSQKPIRVGTLVVFARGPDAAARTSRRLRDEAIAASGYGVHAIGAESGDPNFDLGDLGTSGVETTKNLDDIALAFEETATTLGARLRSYYLLTYCSPSRAGLHKLTVEVKATDPDGTEERGSWDFSFDSTGFGPGCDAATVPKFGRIVIAAPPPPERSAPSEPPDESRPTVVEPQSAPKAPPPPVSRPSSSPVKPASEGGPESGVVPPPKDAGYAPIEE